ncbi:BfmA/BtgA family mobilization protein [Flagellimonas sp. S3867]|uniref:BfmA/BtgA family mobilization protein n=1 Tax=Flagellimonas sp. S3867 TaxID=2768063 RepID=UPI00168337AB|nr:BfmA/BtgA family mobilization protein [Flagellimonas sp. S3867]
MVQRVKEHGFSAISIKVSVANRFRRFSKRIARSHTETLTCIMDFFEWHGFTPNEKFEKNILQEILKNRNRTEASIAIIRDIEITQTKPTNAILHALLEQKVKQEKPMRVEQKVVKKRPEIEITVPRIRYERLTDKMEMLKRESQYVVEHITLVKPSFGKPYLRLEITEGELENYKRTLKNL